MWMKVDLNYSEDHSDGHNWIGIPGILYDQNNQVIDDAKKLGSYLDYLGISAKLAWWNPCTQARETCQKIFGNWGGTIFNIYPGQGIEIIVTTDYVLPLKFGQGYKKHLICTETVDKYCEWSGQEEFDKL